MQQYFDMDLFYKMLDEKTRAYRMGDFVPAGLLVQDILKLCDEFNMTSENERKILEEVRDSQRYKIINVAIEDYIPPNASEDTIIQTITRMLESADIDMDTIFYIGAKDYFNEENDDIIQKIINSLIFSIDPKIIKKGITLHSAALKYMDDACRRRHFQMFPEEFEASKGWVDQSVIDHVKPYTKNGYAPSSIYDEIFRGLLGQYGDRILCENIISQSYDALGIETLPTQLPGDWEPTSDQDLIEKLYREGMELLHIDAVKTYKEGATVANNTHTLDLLRNNLFFLDSSIWDLDTADKKSLRLLRTISEEIYYQNNEAEPEPTVKSDEELRLLILQNAKGNYILQHVLNDHFDALIQKYGKPDIAAKVLKQTLSELNINVASPSKLYQLRDDSNLDKVEDFFKQRIRLWDLEKWGYGEKRPPEYEREYRDLITSYYFSKAFSGDMREARKDFDKLILKEIIHFQRVNHPERFSQDVISNISKELMQKQRNGYIPLFGRNKYVEQLEAFFPQEYSDFGLYLYWDILQELNLTELGLREKDIISPCMDMDELEEQITERIIELDPDFEDYAKNQTFDICEDDEFFRICDAALYAAPSAYTFDEMYEKCVDILFDLYREYKSEQDPENTEDMIIIKEMVNQYIKNRLAPSFFFDEAEAVMRSREISEITIENNINALKEALKEDQILQLEKRHWLPKGASGKAIAQTLVNIAEEYGKRPNDVYAELIHSRPGMNHSEMLQEIENMVFFAYNGIDDPNEAADVIISLFG